VLSALNGAEVKFSGSQNVLDMGATLGKPVWGDFQGDKGGILRRENRCITAVEESAKQGNGPRCKMREPIEGKKKVPVGFR